jgi:hypothetical protein
MPGCRRVSCEELDVGAEAGVVLIVVFLHHQRAVRELRLEMESIRRTTRIKCAHQRRPACSVGANRPDTPQDISTNPLRLQRAEHDPTIRQRHRVQRPGDIQVADLLDIPTETLVGIIHHEQLQREGRITIRRLEAIAIAGEGYPASGKRAGAHVEHTVIVVCRPSRGVRKSSDHGAAPVFGVKV